MKKVVVLITMLAMSYASLADKAFKKPDALFEQGKYTEAIAAYESLAKSAEKSKKAPSYDVTHVYNRLGESYLIVKQYAKSETNFAKAKDKGFKVAEGKFLLNYGNALLANNKFAEALENYQAYQELNPNSTDVLSFIEKAQFAIRSTENPDAGLYAVTKDEKLNATNNQGSLAWYDGAVAFSSDRKSPKGSPKAAPYHLFITRPVYDFRSDKVADWLPVEELKQVKTSDADKAFAYDFANPAYYVMRCKTTKKSSNCNIYAYRADAKGKMGKPMAQSFHNENANTGYPTLSSDGKVMFMVITKDKKSDLYVAKKVSDNKWTTPMQLSTVINTSGAELHPQLYRDSILFFASDGHPGLGGLDIFYSKIIMDGETHAISGNSDLSKIEFTTPENLQAPINSGADDYAMLMKQSGKGGFFISNRTISGANMHNVFNFEHEPYVFNQPGKFLVDRYTLTVKEQAPVDTLALEKAAAAGETTLMILKEKDDAIADREAKIKALESDLAQVEQSAEERKLDAEDDQQLEEDVPSPMAIAPENPEKVAPAPPATTAVDQNIFRVQIAAAKSNSNFRALFLDLHNALPELQMEVIYDEGDGYYRYVTKPFTTYKEADALRSKIKALGYSCFVSEYKGNQRVSMSVR